MCRFVKMLKNFALGCVVGLLPLACVTVAASPSSEMRQVRGQTEDRTAVASQQSPAGNAVDDPLSEKQQRIKTYIENMTYMVYFNEESQEDPFLMGSAVGSANRYLAEGGFEAVNLSQIEQLKKDQMRVYEEETGEDLSLIQWIARRLHADVYVEIDGRTTGETVRDKYYREASVTLTAFEASTGKLLGSAVWNSPKQLSTSSESAARQQALQVCVWKAIPKVIDQAHAYMETALRRGLQYNLIVQNTPDSRVMSALRRSLARAVEEIDVVSQSAEETVYQVFYIGTAAELSDLLYDAAATISELAGLDQVMLRGSSLTFDTGL